MLLRLMLEKVMGPRRCDFEATFTTWELKMGVLDARRVG
jgi:hypothetical protein